MSKSCAPNAMVPVLSAHGAGFWKANLTPIASLWQNSEEWDTTGVPEESREGINISLGSICVWEEGTEKVQSVTHHHGYKTLSLSQDSKGNWTGRMDLKIVPLLLVEAYPFQKAKALMRGFQNILSQIFAMALLLFSWLLFSHHHSHSCFFGFSLQT